MLLAILCLGLGSLGLKLASHLNMTRTSSPHSRTASACVNSGSAMLGSDGPGPLLEGASGPLLLADWLSDESAVALGAHKPCWGSMQALRRQHHSAQNWRLQRAYATASGLVASISVAKASGRSA